MKRKDQNMIESRTEKILHDITQYYEGSPDYDELLVLGANGIPAMQEKDNRKSIFLETEDGYISITVKAEGPFLPGETSEMDRWTGYGARIAELRKIRGMTLGELAEKTGVSKPTILRIETGENDTTVGRLIKIAEALGVSPALLLGERMPELTLIEERLIADYRASDERGKRLVEMVARSERETGYGPI